MINGLGWTQSAYKKQCIRKRRISMSLLDIEKRAQRDCILCSYKIRQPNYDDTPPPVGSFTRLLPLSSFVRYYIKMVATRTTMTIQLRHIPL
jgi:hypothetical protein